MKRASRIVKLAAIGCAVVAVAPGCGFRGLNSLPLPGTVGGGPGGVIYHAELANVSTLEPNSPVMLSDVIVGTVEKMSFDDWHVDVQFSVRPEVAIPANAVATIGQTSLLGSLHLALDPRVGEAPSGRLQPNSTISLADSSIFPSTEQTLSVLSTVVNGGSLGQAGDIIHGFNEVLNGKQSQIRDLIARFNHLMGVLAEQQDNIAATIDALRRLATTLAGQDEVIRNALERLPKALEVLAEQRPRVTTALERLRDFSDTSVKVINAGQADLVENLNNLAPTIRALADVGPHLPTALSIATKFPYNQDTLDRGLKGDYMNLWASVDLTIPRLKRTMFLGTRWGDNDVQLVPAPGEPFGIPYTDDPMTAALNPPPQPPDPIGALPGEAPPNAHAPAPAPQGPGPAEAGGN
ncbi:MCE family protein [Mycobacterium sp. 236(2023)]|uniref:MCE family protein n=1 Tax=Mycobacterium sp. 236(2023) TaxID=3038163 RepID=UPI0024152CB2|nr:MCE family protein [Mycobacterium sp. 236(2023)]MDG4667920.1 MCE family protein [Mycobacterium sp. 236(2023)]